MDKMIGILIVLIALCIAVYWQYLEDRIREQAFKNYNRKLLAKHGTRRREIIFVEEEAEMKCEYCGREISREEYERERHGYCDECADDLMTEEEEELWGM